MSVAIDRSETQQGLTYPPLRYTYSPKKTTQVAAYLIKLGGGSINYMKLIKLMYLADRCSLDEWGRPITGDRFFSLPKGPVLTTVLSYISSGRDPNDPDSYWFDNIAEPVDYKISSRDAEPPVDELSQRELEVLDFVFEEFRDFDQWQMVEYCHDNLPEWEDPEGSSTPIPFERVLAVLGKSPETISEIKATTEFASYARRALGTDSLE